MGRKDINRAKRRGVRKGRPTGKSVEEEFASALKEIRGLWRDLKQEIGV